MVEFVEQDINFEENSSINTERDKYKKMQIVNKENLKRFVNVDGTSIKDAARKLGIQYSSAKFIIAKSKKQLVSENQLKRRGAPKKTYK